METCDQRPVLVVHGGAGNFGADRLEAARAGCRQAVEAGLRALAAGRDVVDAVQEAVRALEDDPTFNAGVGSVLSRAGTVECDAAMMDGRDLRFGGIAAMPNIRRAIDVARVVMDAEEHMLLCADGAWLFAREHGFEPCDPAELITDRSLARLAAEARKRTDCPDADHDPGTVGACAAGGAGHVAVATSTGGMTGKRIGRVGDTPLAGCGTYADDRGGAASATGNGETIIRVTLTRQCVDTMRTATASEAAWQSVGDLEARVGGSGGVVCCDTRGRVGAAHCSPQMAWGAGRLERDGSMTIIADMWVPHGQDIHTLFDAAAGH